MLSTANEWDHLLLNRFDTMILKPQHIDKVWDSSHMKEDLIAILQDHFKPKSSIEQEKVEYNEINIFSEYQLHNLIYAKNELLLTSPKCALLLHQFWRLLEFNPDAPKGTQDQAEEEAGSNRVSRMNTANPTDQQHAANSE